MKNTTNTTNTTNTPYQLSIVTTVDAQKEICTDFAQKLALYTNHQKLFTQLIFVDDLHALTQKITPNNNEFLDIEIITPPIRQGQFKAILLGLQKTSANIILVIDPDMSQNINDISLFMEKIHTGSHIVFGRRVKRLDTTAIRKSLSNLFNFFVKYISKIKVNDINTPMIMLSRNAVDALNNIPPQIGAHKIYLCYLFKKNIDEISIIVYRHPLKKKSNYTFIMLIIVLFESLFQIYQYIKRHHIK